MNTSQLSKYAPEARRAFIASVTAQAAGLGLRPDGIEPIVEEGDVALIGGQPFPRSVAEKRRRLEERIARTTFDQTMESIAYTWFNRFVAIRYMELHGYLDHGYRVLSHPEAAGRPEILDHAADIDLPGLDREKVIELKLDGTQDEALYRLLLLAQCNALHQAMPFLFERLGDETELLLPANLLHTDSLIRQLVEQVDEALWQEIEIIGWLYQFYISEKKDQVIGKVVKSEDIPAATQLFTPNWIVKYMVQNSLGAQWLATYPQSPLKGQMEYYIEPAEQTDQVQEQLRAITPTTLNPEALTLIDPASGSGHILVEAYELFRATYLERGYRKQDVAQLILEKNLYGLEICPRAAQLTGFALMMKARADDKELFDRGIQLNVMALVDSAGFDAEGLAQTKDAGVELGNYGLKLGDLTELKRLFEHSTTFGSLIQVPEGLREKLPALKQLSEATSQDLFVSDALKRLGPLVRQAELLAAQYDAVVANPPYMGSKFYCPQLKDFVGDTLKAGKADLYGAFALRNMLLAKVNGHVGMITIPNWMFLSSFEELRNAIFCSAPISSLVHNGRGVWGSDFGSCSYVLRRASPRGFSARFLRLFDKQGSVAGNEELERRFHANVRFSTSNTAFGAVPGSPVAYWLSEQERKVFSASELLSDVAAVKQGLATCNNGLFVRHWYEVDYRMMGLGMADSDSAHESGAKWFPYNKGGGYRKWFGNNLSVVNWQHRGKDIHEYSNLPMSYAGAPVRAKEHYFHAGITYGLISMFGFSTRNVPSGFVFDVGGSMIFSKINPERLLGFLCSALAKRFIDTLNPTLNYQVGDVARLPVLEAAFRTSSFDYFRPIRLAKLDEDAFETSWDFQSLPLLTASSEPTPTLESSYTAWTRKNRDTIAEMKRLEEENNRLFIDAYGLGEELTPDVPLEQITLTVNPAYRYGGKLTEAEQWTRLRQDTCEELVSYAIGCMMGRYSLDEPGLIYAHSGNEGFDPSRYTTYPADDDGIIPITDYPWFEDDAAHRFERFLAVAWPKEHLEENLKFVAENLSPKKGERPRDTIRRHLANGFFKQHLSTYKKRPIYWLFTSGKQKAFQCLVYLHRYNEGTLARMRTEYVIPLQGKIASRIDQLDGDIAAATSTSHRKKLEKERDTLVKQRTELQEFDEKLRHYADQRIHLDLDDGVKVNYGKFGDLLAEVKAVHGKKVN